MFFVTLSVFAVLVGECRATDAQVSAERSQDEQGLTLCTDRSDLDEGLGCNSDEELSMEVSLLQTHFAMAGSKLSGQQAADAGAGRKGDGAAVSAEAVYVSEVVTNDGVSVDITVQNLQAQRVAELLSAGYDDALKMEQRHWTLLMVVVVFTLTVTVALTTKAAQQRKKKGELDFQHLKIDFSATKTMGSTVALKEPPASGYPLPPEKCTHNGQLRWYSARKQKFRICDQCGSRWILHKDTETYTPIAPRTAPSNSDPE